MEYTRQLIDFLPERIRDRIDQDEDTLIAHFANAIQPGLDTAIDIIEDEPDFYDPEICPVGMIDWLGQLVGLAKAGDNHLGLGLGSAWTNQHKRMAIARAWHYWQIKGTRLGITEAISIWLDWNPTPGNSLEIKKPFGEVPIHTPPQWAGWNSPYYGELIVPYRQVRRWGGGEIPGDNHLTNYNYLPPVGSQPSLGEFIQVPVTANAEQLVSNINAGLAIPDLTITAGVQRLAQRQLIRSRGAANSTNRPWMHFLIEQGDWAKISPNIAHLNPEIWSARTDAVPFTWLNLTPTIPVALTAPATADLFGQSSSWRLTVVTSDDAYSVRPITNYLLDATGKGKFVPTQSQEIQRIEFAFTPIRIAAVRRIQIAYLGAVVLNFVPTKALHLDPLIQFGVVAKLAATVGAALPIVGVILDTPVVGVVLDVPIVGVELTPLPEVSVSSLWGSRLEDSSFAGYAFTPTLFRFVRTQPVLTPLIINIQITGTLTYGVDYFLMGEYAGSVSPLPTTVTIPSGYADYTLEFYIFNDQLVEPDETLTVTIVPAAGITVAAGQQSATITALNDDIALPTISVAAASSIAEGNPTLSAPTVLPFNTHRLIAGAHAFTGASGIFISDNSAVANFPPESLLGYANLNLRRPLWYKWTAPTTGPVRLKVRYTGTYTAYPTVGGATCIQIHTPYVADPTPAQLSFVTDNRSANLLALDPLLYFYAQTGNQYYICISTNATGSTPPSGYVGFEIETLAQTFFTISRTGDLTNGLTVGYTLSPISSRADRSYFIGTQAAVFAPGASTVLVKGLTDANALLEADTNVTLTLTPASGTYALGANSSATFTITDDEAPPD